MRKLFIFSLLLFLLTSVSAQQNENRQKASFQYPNGKPSSEGWLVEGKPDGYWKTWYENGQLKSEGNRLNFELDSLWKFYDEQGQLKLEIWYKNGRKNGERISYLPDESLHENFVDDSKNGFTNTYDRNGHWIKAVPFENGLENGLARVMDTTGLITELITYQKGFITAREKINRVDAENKKQGLWKWFYADGKIQSEGTYKHGLKNGVFKTYDQQGNLKNIEKYLDDQKQTDAEEITKLEVKRDYFPNGKIKIEGTYRNGQADGIRREFNEKGEVEKTFLMKNGQVTAEGIVEANGQRKGVWKEFYPDGSVKANGQYTDDFKSGYWEYFHPNGTLEQKGSFDEKGQYSGVWQWYDESSRLIRTENFRNGVNDGELTEYDSQGNLILQGYFINGKEEGKWIFNTGGMHTEGEYSEGLRNGTWKTFYNNGKAAFEGRFIDDNPHGKYTSWYDNGRMREEGEYQMGLKKGEWKKFDDEGVLMLSISYQNGVERKYDGISLDEEDVIPVEEN